MTAGYLRALSDSIEQVCCLPATFAWDRKATAYADIVNLLADAAANRSWPFWSGTFQGTYMT